jgi:peptidyl-prolyl cis-trans isomerase B (cyclophilin B)
VGKTKARRQRELAMAKLVRQAERRVAARRRRRRIAAAVTAGALALSATLITVLLLVNGSGDDASALTAASASPSGPAGANPTPGPTSTPAAPTSVAGPCTYTSDGRGPSRPVSLPPAAADVAHTPATMVIETNKGTMKATLDAAKAPCTVYALRTLAEAKYFHDTPCHRQTGGADAGIYVLQCGDPTGSGSGGPGFTYKNENTDGVTYDRGVLAMANAGPDTNGSQFFINYKDPTSSGQAALAGKYTVFGKITSGLNVLDALTSPGVKGGGGDGAPASGAHITSITITQPSS